MAKRVPVVNTLLFLLFALVLNADAYGQSGAFTIDNISTVDVSDCTTADGEVVIRINSTDFGLPPYDVSLDNGATWIANNLTPDGSGDIIVTGQFWGSYAIAVRDDNSDIVYPGYAQIGGCVYDACSPGTDDFTIAAVTGATGYTWTTTVGSVASGAGTTSVELDLSGLSPGVTGTVCVQPTGDACTAPNTCFEIRILCPEICNNGVDDDLDGLTDCLDPDCSNPIVNAGVNQEICLGASASLNALASGGTPGYTYAWDNGLGAGASQTVTPAATTTYTVTVTDFNGCTATDDVVVTVNTLPSGTITSTNTACGTSNGVITITTPNFPTRPGIQYSIDNGATYSAAVAPDGSDFEFTGLAAGPYNLWARWSDGDCPVSLGSETVGTNPGPSVSIAPVSPVCAGTSVSLVSTTVGGTAPYGVSWSAGLGSSATATVTPPSNALSNRTTTYTVTVTDDYGCVDTESIDVTVYANPSAIVTGEDEHCGLGDGEITFTFSDNTDRTSIQFSTDGGSTYAAAVNDNSGTYTVSSLSAATYNVFARWGGGDCPVDLGSITLNNTAAPTVNAGADVAICPGGSTTITAVGAGGGGSYTYAWDNGLGAGASHTVSPAIATTYTVTVTDGDGCTNTDDVFVDIHTLPSGTITSTNTACGTSNGVITITTPNFPTRPGIQYSIDNGATYSAAVAPDGSDFEFTGLAAGTYNLWARWSNGDCPVSLGSETVGTNPGPSVSIAPVSPVCAGTSVSLVSTTVGGTAPYGVSWSAGLGSSATATVTPPSNSLSNRTTTYTVTVTDDHGCVDTESIDVTVYANPSVSVTGEDEHCALGDGEITFTFLDNADRTSIQFSTDGGSTYTTAVNDNSGTFTVSSLSAATYNVFARWGGGDCPVDLGSITLNSTAAPTVNAFTNVAICPGGSTTITAVGAGGGGSYTYAWDNGLGAGASHTVSPAVTTTYTVTVTDADGCTNTDDVVVTVNTLPSGTVSSQNTDCGTSNGVITITTPNFPTRPGIQYSRDNGATYSAAVAPDGSDFEFTGLAAGPYNLWARWSNGDCPVSLGSETVGTNAGPSVSIAPVSPVCAGTSVSLVSTTVGGTAPYGISWSAGLGSSGTATVTPPGNPLSNRTTTYTVTVTDDNGCVDTESIDVTVYANPSVIVTGDDEHCGLGDGEITFTFSDNADRTSIQFSTDGGSTYAAAVNDNSGTFTVSSLSAATYNVFARWGGGDCPVDLGSITLNNTAAPTVNAGADVAICPGGSTTITAVGAGGGGSYTYAWDNGLGAGASHTVSPAVTTTYTVTVTDGDGCTNTDDVVVTVNTPPSGTVSSTNTACGTSNGVITITTPNFPARPGIQYSIDNGATYSAAVAPDGSDFDFTGLAAGSYNLWARWSNGDCPVFLGSEAVGNNAGPSVAIAAVADVCEGTAVTLDATVSGGTGTISYVWRRGATVVGSTEDVTLTPPHTPLGDRTTTYTLTATDASGCTNSGTVEVTVVANPRATLTKNDENCGLGNGEVILTFSDNIEETSIEFSLDGGSTYAAAVNDNTGTYTFGSLSAGSYDIYARWDGGLACPVDLGSVTLNNTAAPTVNAGADVAICPGGSTTITAVGAGGGGSFTYAWDNGLGAGASHTVSPAVTTTYTVTVTDADGCTNTDDVVVDIHTLPSGTITHTNSACGTSNGTLTITTPNFPARPGIQYSIDNGTSYSASITPDGGTHTVTGLAAQAYNIYARWDNGDCPVFLGTETVSANGGPTVTIAPIAEVCAGETAQLIAVPSGGTGPYTYSWSNGLSSIANPVFTPPSSPSADRSTTYSVTVTDNFGCSTTASQTVVVRATPVASLSPVFENCGQSDGGISVSITDNTDETTIAFSTDGGTTYGATVNDNIGTHTIGGLSAATYTVFARWGDNSCPINLGDVTVTNRAAPLANAGSNETICPGESVTLVGTSSGDFGTMSYAWDNGLGAGASHTVTPASTTTYTLTVSNSFGCSTTDQVTITVEDNVPPVLFGVPANEVVECDAIPLVAPVVATDNCSTPTVTPSETSVAGSCANEEIITRVWTADDGNGNTATASQIITVQDNTPPTFMSVPSNTTIECGTATPSAMATATDACGAVTVTVATSAGAASCAGDAIIRTFTATDACGNTATTSQVVTIQDTTDPVFSTTPANVSVTPTTIPAVPSITASDACDMSITPVYNQVQVGSGCSYTLERTWTATDGCLNSIVHTQIITVTNSLSAAASVTSAYNGFDISCPLAADGEVTVVPADGAPPYTYLWNDGATSAVNGGLSAGTYSVTVTDSEGCTTTASVDVDAPPALTVVPTISDVSCNGNNDGQISLAISGGAGPYAVSWSSGQTTPTIGTLLSGDYTYTVTDQNSCNTSATLNVAQPASLGSSITVETNHPGGTAISCFGADDADLEAFPTGGTPPYSYTWSTGESSKTISGVGPGPISVTVVDDQGCTSVANANVTEPLVLSTNIIAVSNYDGFGVSCTGASDGSIRANPSGGTPPYSYVWSSGAVTAQANNLGAGPHSVTVTDVNGCTTSSSFTISAPPAVTANATVSSDYNSRDVTCFNNADGAVTVTPGGGTAPYTYSWSTGALTQTVSGLFPGTYSVTVADKYGCTAAASVTIANTPQLTVSPALDVTYGTYGVSCNGATDAEIGSNATGGTPPYSYSWTGGQTTSSAVGLGAGSYFVTVTDANGCTVTGSAVVNEPPSFSFTTSSSEPTDCGVDDGIILVNASGGSGSFQYSIDGTTWQTANSFTGLSSGNYSVYVRTEFGTCPIGPIVENVQVADSPTIDGVTIINPQTGSSNDGGILVNASGNGIQLEYQLQGVTGWQTSDLFENLSPGTYTILVRYLGQSCIATREVTLVAGGGVIGSTNLNSCSDELSETSFIEVYFIPFQEDHMLDAFENHYTGFCGSSSEANDPIVSYISIGIAETGTEITFDQWEDGYEPNLGFPVSSTTEVWGDGDPTNGIAPGYAVDYFQAGDIIVLDNQVVSTTRGTVFDFDGGDKIGSRGYLSITRLGWALNIGTFMAGAIEVLPTYDWGTEFTFPVGRTGATNSLFEYAGATIMAMEDNTSVTISNNGSTSIVVLNQGESHHILGGYSDYDQLNPIGIVTGDNVVSDKPIQVHLITGDVCENYEGRWFTLRPDSDWSSEYINPVSTRAADRTDIHIFNPGPGMLNARVETQSGTTTVSVPAGTNRSFPMPNGSGARIYANGGRKFYAIATTDSDQSGDSGSDGDSHYTDWGFSLVPTTKLSQQIAIVGFAPGKDPNDGSGSANNASPIWITPYSSTSPTIRICIDFNGDGGSTPDANGIFYDQAIVLNNLASHRIYDADGDQTGMRIWVCDGGDGLIAGAYGQEPGAEINSVLSLDLGTGIINGVPFTATKCAALTNDVNGNGLYDECDEVTYTVTVRNSGTLPLGSSSLTLVDTLSSELTYINASTRVITTAGVSNVADNVVGTAFPIDEVGYVHTGITINPGDSLILQFSATINNLSAATFVRNQAFVYNNSTILSPEVSIAVQTPISPFAPSPMPVDMTTTCSSIPAPPSLGSSPSTVYTETRVNGSCPYNYVLERRWTTTDDCGNVFNLSQDITVQDIIPPVLAGVPANVTVTSTTIPASPCSGGSCGGIVVATDNCSTFVPIGVTETIVNRSCEYDIERLFTARDDCGNTATGLQIITVVSPVSINIVSQRNYNGFGVSCNGATNGEAVVSASGGRTPYTFTWTGGLTGASQTGLAATTYTVTAEDQDGCTASTTVTITEPTPLNLTANPTSNFNGVNISCFNATDGRAFASASGGAGGYTYLWSTGMATQAVENLAAATSYSVTVTDQNGCSTSQSLTLTGPTELTGTLSQNSTLSCFGDTDAEVEVVPAGGTPPYAYAWNVGGASSTLSSIGQGTYSVLVTDANSCTFSGSITVNQPAQLITDAGTGSSVCPGDAVVLNATSTGGTAPLSYVWDNGLGAGQSHSVSPTTTTTYTVTVTDFEGCTTTDNITIVINSCTEICDDGIDNDGDGLVDCLDGNCQPNATILNPISSIGCPGETVNFLAADAGSGANYAWTFGPNAVPTTATGIGPHAVVFNNCASQSAVLSVTITGCTTTDTRTFSTDDTTPPTFSFVPASTTIECGTAVPTTMAVAADACGGTPTVTVANTTGPASCAGDQVIRTFTATDFCGNTSTASQVITIDDTQNPVLTNIPSDVTLECGTAVPTSLPTVSDGCDLSITVVPSTTSGLSTCAGTQVIRIFTATDNCSNTITARQIVSFQDTQSPVLTNIPAAVTIECGAATPSGMPTASDACDATVALTVVETSGSASCARDAVIRTFTATDDCGNTATASQVVTIEDTTAPTFNTVPAAANLDCGDAMPTTMATATDVCDATVSVTVVETEVSRTSPNAYVVHRTFTATDDCGNTATASQVVTFSDTGAPTWTSVPADVDVECGDPIPTTLAVAEDDCDGPLTVTPSDVTAATCGATYVITRTFEATDADGNVIRSTQVITIEDTTNPTFTSVPGNVTIECGATLPTNLAVAIDDCDADVVVSVVSSTGAASCAGDAVVRTFTATDDCGNTATASQLITIQDTTDPVLANIPANTTIECGAAVPSDLPTVTDNCDPSIVVTVTTSVGPSTCAGDAVIRTFRAVDACGNSSTASQVVTIQDVTAPVLANVPAAITIECGAATPTSMPTASDVCDGTPTITVVETAGATSCAGDAIIRTFTATDDCGNTSTASQVVTIEDTTAPVFATVPGPVTIECGAALPTTMATATDACDGSVVITVAQTTGAASCAGDAVIRTFTATDACGNTNTAIQVVTIEDTTAPTFASVPADVTIECGAATPTDMATASDVCAASVSVSLVETVGTNGCAGDAVIRTFTATDACGNTATASQVVTIEDTTAPTFTSVPAAVTIECGAATPTDMATATDVCDASVAITVAETTGAADCSEDAIIRTFTATDNCGNTSTASQVVTIEDTTAPVFATVPGPVTIECGTALPATMATATDVCDASVAITVAETAGAASCAGDAVIRTFTATDACGNTTTASQVVTIEDTTAPVFASVPADVTIECGAALPTNMATATDVCAAAVSVSVVTSNGPLGCAGNTIIRTFTAADACGNTTTARQFVTIEDTTAPTFASVPADVTIECGAATPTDMATATDVCDASVSVTVVETTGAANCSEDAIIRTFTATDNCGNTSTASQVVTIEDTTAPTFASVPADITIECGAATPTDMATATDVCDASVSVTVVETAGATSCAGDAIIRTFTATDACGNTTTASQVVTIEDTTAPVFTSVPGTAELSCGDPMPTDMATATDVCDAGVVVTVVETEVSRTSLNTYTVHRTFTATDACSNATTAVQVVNYSDDGPPIWTSVPANVTIECGAAVPNVLATAEDPCDGPLTVTSSDVTAPACGSTYEITRTFETTDADGNSITTAQVITIEDTTAPTFASVPADITIECGAATPTDMATATDVCDPSVSVTVAETAGTNSCAGDAIIRTFTATDACGNTATASQVVTIEDTTAPTFASVPAAVTIECGAATPTDMATATDVCDASVAITVVETAGAASCAGDAIIRTFTATDNCGNTSTASQVVTIEDTTAPVLNGVPVSVLLECNDPLPTDMPTASDICDINVGITVVETRIDGATPNDYVIERVFTATDNCGNTTTASQVVTYQDSGAPFWTTVPANDNIECGDAMPTDLAIAEDDCDGILTVTYTDAESDLCGETMIVTRTFSATDADGNEINTAQIIVVSDNTAPVFDFVPAAMTIECGDAVPSMMATATDVCDPAVSVTVSNTSGASSCAGNAVIRTFTATDACGNSTTASQLITIEDTNAPTFTSVPADVTIECGQPTPTGMATASDVCGSAAVVVVETAGAASCAGDAMIRTFTATDDCGNTATAVQVVTIEDTTVPVFANVPAPVEIDCNDPLPTDAPTASDICDNAVVITESQNRINGATINQYEIVRTWTAEDLCGNTSTATQVVSVVDDGLPAWTSVPSDETLACTESTPTVLATAEDGCDGALMVTVSEVRTNGSCGGAYIIVRTFTATDVDGNAITTSHTVTFEDTVAPTFTSVPADVTIACASPEPTDMAAATDNCGEPVTVVVNETRAAGSCTGSEEVTRVFTATDACGNSTSAQQIVTIEDVTSPTFTGVPADVTIACTDALPQNLPSAGDECSAVTLTEDTRTVTGSCTGNYVVVRTFTATDACGNTTTVEQRVTFEDTTAPVFAGVPTNVTFDCGTPLPTTAPTATDDCGTVDITYDESTSAGSCAGSYTVTRRWTATDDCGNAASTEQQVTYEDTEAPVFDNLTALIELDCQDSAPLVMPTAADACGTTGAITYADTRINGSCAQAYTIVRTFSVADDCGNASSVEQRIVFTDNTAPVITNVPSDVTISCDMPIPTSMPSATDYCQASVSIVELEEIIPGPCANSYILVRVFVATDDCGNRSEARQNVEISDTEAPVFVRVPANVEAGCGSALSNAQPIVIDNCDLNVTISYSQYNDTSGEGCGGLGALVRVWTATDNCGNTASASQRVIFVDNEPPVLSNLVRAVSTDCNSSLDFPPPTATDNCDQDVYVYYDDERFSEGCNEVVRRVWIAVDDCGNETTAIQDILIVDDKAPEINGDLSPITLECGEAFPEVDLMAHDDCDADLTISEETFELGGGSCPGETTIYRIFTVLDDCGNQAEAVQIVTIKDVTAPVFTMVPENMDAACETFDFSAIQPQAEDGCSDEVTISEVSTGTTVTRDGRRMEAVVRTWTAKDACGNTAQVSQTIVFDTENPTITAQTHTGAVQEGAPVCAGDMVTFIAPAGGSTYQWSNGETTQQITVEADVPQTYEVTFSGNACNGNATFNLQVVEAPSFGIVDIPAFCDGQTVNLQVVATGVNTITWSGPLGFTSSGPETKIEYIASIQEGWYVASAQAIGGCSVMDSIYVTVGAESCAEICGNGIDDDGDGLVDCDDPDCNCCALEQVVLRTECRDGGTPDDISDDSYAVYALLKGSGITGSAFTVTGSANIPTLYANGEVLLGVYPSTTPMVSFDFIGVDDASCSMMGQQAFSPGACTNYCSLHIVKTEVTECVEGQYDLLVTVLYANPSGALRINGKRFSLPNNFGELTFTLPKLSCTGDVGIVVEAYFVGQTACNDEELYDAPCPDEACLPVEITVGDRP